MKPLINSLMYSKYGCIVLIFIALTFLVGCNGNNKHQQKENITISDSIKCVKKDDSKDFLPAWSKKNIIVYQVLGEPDGLHPTNGNSALRFEMNLYMHGFLNMVNLEKLDINAGIAKTMPIISDDQLIYSYELRDEPKWDDGKQLTVDDIIFTFKANKCPLVENPESKDGVENIKDILIDKNNQRKFSIVMKRRSIVNQTFAIDFPIMERNYFDASNVLSNYTFNQFDDTSFRADKHKDLSEWAKEFNNEKYGRNPQYMNGLGMYKLTKWDEGQSLTLEKKTNHWTQNSKNYFEAAYPDKIILKIVRDPNAQMLELKSQGVDATSSLSPKVLLELQKDSSFNKNYNSEILSTYNYSFVSMNMKPDGFKHKKLFIDKKVRRAMALLMPLDEMNKILNHNILTRINGPVSPLKKEYNSDLKLIPFDVEKAKKLLDEAGWKDTDGDNVLDKMIDGQKVKFEFDINFPNVQVEWKDAATMIAEALYKAGIKANLNPLDPKTHSKKNHTHDFDMAMGAWGETSLPADYTQTWHSKSWATGGDNFTGFGTPESDALIDSIKYEINPSKYIPMVKRLQAIIYDEQPYVFTFAGTKRLVVHKRFGNCNFYFDRPGLLLNTLKLLAPKEK